MLELDSGFTIGAIELQRQATLMQLVQKNPSTISLINGEYITLNAKLTLPLVVQKIALITAPGSDGERDFKHELNHNAYGYHFEVDSYLTQIQGKDADKAILGQLDLILDIGKKYDLIAIVRGGGAQLDFSAFDTYDVGLKIATFPIPIVAGIGHERNVSIADLMCFASLKTPTKAASFIIEHNTIFEQQVERLKARLVKVTEGIMQSSKNNLEKASVALIKATEIFFKDKHHALQQKSLSIKFLDPSNVLARGYAILQNKQGIIMQANLLSKGEKITAITKDAELHLITEEVKKKAPEN